MHNTVRLFILSLLLYLSACGHVRTQHNETVTQGSRLPTGIESPVIKPHINDAKPSTTEAVIEKQYSNILDRIRAGFAFPDLSSKHVDDYLTWDTEHPTYLKHLFERAEPFLFHIVEEIEKRGLPMELALLPAIESSYKANAISRSKAAGLWQFIPSTGRHFGLQQNWWYDGRRNVISATTAALDYLTQLNHDFNGDWFLALAAYNAGGGTVRRALKKSTTKRYQDLALSSETLRYVPKIIALKKIIQNPTKFAIKLPTIPNQAYFDKISFTGQINLNKFSAQTDIDIKLLTALNAGFLRWASPPSGPRQLLVPLTKIDIANKVIANTKVVTQNEYLHHKIAKGETLSSISKRYSTSINAIKTANNLSSTRIHIGRNLLVPFNKKVHIGHNTLAHKTPTQVFDKLVHHVKPGETLWSISQHYRVRVKQLMAWNGLSPKQFLHPNQPVLVYPN